jgi:two-component system, NarL family, sensor kinase
VNTFTSSVIKCLCLVFLIVLLGQCSYKEESLQEGYLLSGQLHFENDSLDLLVERAWQQLATNPDSVRLILGDAFEFCSPQDNIRKMKLYNIYGVSYFIQSAHQKALENYSLGLDIATKLGHNERKASFNNNIGIVYLHNGHYLNALEHFLLALDYYQKEDQPFQNVNTLNNIGILYYHIENYETAVKHLDRAYEGFLATSDSLGLAAVNNSRGAMFLKKQMPDSALFYLDKSIDMAMLTSNRYGLSGNYLEKARVFSFMGNKEKMLEFFKKAEQVSSGINYKEKTCEAKIGIAQALMSLNDKANSLKYAREAEIIAETLGNDKLRMEIQLLYSKLYESTGEYKKSLYHKNIFHQLKDALIDESKLHQFYSFEIQQLNFAKEIQQLEIQRQKLLLNQKNSVIIFITLVFLMIMSGAYLLYRNHRYRQLANHQTAIVDLTEKKSRAAVEAEIQERARIGRELHDGLGQMLSVVRMNMSVLQQKTSLNNERKKELLEAAISSVDKAFYELRDISHNLTPSAMSQKGFIGALKDLCDQVNKSNQMQMHLEIYGYNDTQDNLIENTLFRAIQELLNNAIKHAGASQLFIQLVKNENEITLIVEDNGKGFDIKKIFCLPGIGLRNIGTRVENLNGTFHIDAMLDRGTIVTIVIPLKKIPEIKKGKAIGKN